MFSKYSLLISLIFIPNSFIQAKPISGMLAAHNKERALHKLPPLRWSPHLEKYAQEWADHLAKYKRCNMQHRPRRSGGRFKQKFGENLFWASPIRWKSGREKAQKITGPIVVHDWAAEKKYFNLRINQCFPGQQCGHYTQIIWKATTQVGCGKAMCEDKSQIWVCNYNPAGNLSGRRPY